MERTIGIVLFVFLAAGIAFVQVHYYRERRRAETECERLEQRLLQMQKQYADVAEQNDLYRRRNHEWKKYQWLVQVLHENMSQVTQAQLVELILQKKKQEAVKRQIVFDVQGIWNGTACMDEMALVSFLMNLLDNAIEASVQTEHKVIQLAISEDCATQTLQLVLKNSKKKEQKLHVDESRAGYRTTKEERAVHGYGTQIIQHIVGENGGTIEYADCGNAMRITCRLRMEEKERSDEENII